MLLCKSCKKSQRYEKNSNWQTDLYGKEGLLSKARSHVVLVLKTTMSIKFCMMEFKIKLNGKATKVFALGRKPKEEECC